jgi:hypothetical protein
MMQGKIATISPIPNKTLTNGLKIQFIRKPKPILITDTTRELSLPSTFHKLVALYTSFFFARAKQMAIKNDLFADIQNEERKLGIHVKAQDRNYSSRMIPNVENNH